MFTFNGKNGDKKPQTTRNELGSFPCIVYRMHSWHWVTDYKRSDDPLPAGTRPKPVTALTCTSRGSFIFLYQHIDFHTFDAQGLACPACCEMFLEAEHYPCAKDETSVPAVGGTKTTATHNNTATAPRTSGGSDDAVANSNMSRSAVVECWNIKGGFED